MNKIKHILSFLILIVIGFLFLHSELDLFTPEQHFHTTHDFCDIINGAKTENVNLDNAKILNIDLYNNFLNIPILVSTDIHKSIINPQKTKTVTKFNILYSSFLI